MTKAQLLAVDSTAGLGRNGCSPEDLTDEQRRQILQAAQEAYDKLRWFVGDSREIMSELQLLARDSFLEGMRQERSNAPVQARPEAVACNDGLEG